MTPVLPSFEDVKAAAARIAPYAYVTPLVENAALNARAGRRVLLKLETLQRTGAFKFRGACNRILAIPEAERGRGVVAYSSGNHAQAVAAVAALLGMKATIVMPADAPRAKIAATRGFGAQIVPYDRARESREEIAAALQAKSGATLVKPFDDAAVIAGQGTAGLEIAATARTLGAEPDCVLAPASGGGLVSGIALALSHVLPAARVFSVEPENFASMKLSLEQGARTPAPARPPSQADSLMSPFAGELPFALGRKYLAGGIAVTDGELDVAMSYAARRLKLIAEPGGAAALAALLAQKAPADRRCVVVVLSGGNADFETVAAACARVPEP
jgi:threonine dehydratase